MASTTQQELHGQALDQDLPSERETHTTTMMAAPEKEAPRFESFPPEIRNMIYRYLLPPAYLRETLRQRLSLGQWNLEWTYVLHETNNAILRTNRIINKEASAVLYRNIVLVSIDWNTNDRDYLKFVKMPQSVTFNYALPDAPLPPCVVRVQHQYHDENIRTARTSTIITAADFPGVCRRLLVANLALLDRFREAKTSYSVISLPRIGYNVDMLRELIWIPLRRLRDGRTTDLGETTHRNLRPIDCTGVFEKTAAKLDWDRQCDHVDSIDRDGSDQCDRNCHGSDTNASGKEGNDEEDSDDERGKINDDEDGGNKAHEYCSNASAEKTAHGAASKSDHN